MILNFDEKQLITQNKNAKNQPQTFAENLNEKGQVATCPYA